MPDDKIDIETKSYYYAASKVATPALSFESLLAAITELYAKGSEIGWETKILDPLGNWVRKAHKDARNG